MSELRVQNRSQPLIATTPPPQARHTDSWLQLTLHRLEEKFRTVACSLGFRSSGGPRNCNREEVILGEIQPMKLPTARPDGRILGEIEPMKLDRSQ